jgi:lysozyme family protein
MSFEKAVAAVLKHEGGYVNDPRDRGGETNFGITRAAADANGFGNPLSSMTRRDAEEIYRRAYWNKCGLDGVDQVDEGTAEKLFDIAVNMGIGTAGQFLQRALNLLNRNQSMFADLKVDGQLGPGTVDALHKLQAEDLPVLRALLTAYQGRRYIDIIEHDSTQERFTRGWINRLREQEGA